MSNNTAAVGGDIGESERQLQYELARLVDAGISIIQVKTREPGRTLASLRKTILLDPGNAYIEYDIVHGTRRDFTLDNYANHAIRGTEPMDYVPAMKAPLQTLHDGSANTGDNPPLVHYVFNVPMAFTNNNPVILELLTLYFSLLPATRIVIILVTPNEPVNLPAGMVHVLNAPTPTLSELTATLRDMVEASSANYEGGADISEEEYTSLARLGLGLTKDEFDNCVCLTLIDNPARTTEVLTAEPFYEGISKGKTEVVKQSDILELYPIEDISHVAGMKGFKAWLEDRIEVFSEDAIEFGIQPPKAVALVGVPGTGKSLLAKAAASVLGVPLLRLDFGKVFSKWVGDSESRMRAALDMVSSMGQLVLMVDEIDKGLGGIGGGGQDGGTSARVLGTFLTWMNDNNSGVLCIVTANRIDGLPPELFRKGRMDQTFWVGLPNPEERREVLAVHLEKRGRNIEDFEEREISQFVQASEGFVPAEIEQAVKDGLILAFKDKGSDDLSLRHVQTALQQQVPMSRSNAEQIDAIIEWGRANAISVSEEPVAPNAAQVAHNARRMPRTSRRVLGE